MAHEQSVSLFEYPVQLKPVALQCTSEEPTTGNSKALVAERKTKGRIGMAAGWGWEGRRREAGRETFDGDEFIFGAIDVIAIKLYIEIQ